MSQGIIKVTTPQGKILLRYWITDGIACPPEPGQGPKWDFSAEDEKGEALRIQIGLDEIPEVK